MKYSKIMTKEENLKLLENTKSIGNPGSGNLGGQTMTAINSQTHNTIINSNKFGGNPKNT